MTPARGAFFAMAVWWNVTCVSGELYPLSGYGPGTVDAGPEPWKTEPAYIDAHAARRMVDALPAGTYRPLPTGPSAVAAGRRPDGWSFRPYLPPVGQDPAVGEKIGRTSRPTPPPGYRFRPRTGGEGRHRYHSYDPIREAGAGTWRNPLPDRAGEGYYPADISAGYPGRGP